MKATPIVLLAVSGSTHAGIHSFTQSLSFEWGLDVGSVTSAFDAFDDTGGTRELVGVSCTRNAGFSVEVEALNYSGFEISLGGWTPMVMFA